VDTAYFYSDETGSHTKGRYFLVAGVVLTRHQKWIADQLHHAERVSGKGKQDWKRREERQDSDSLPGGGRRYHGPSWGRVYRSFPQNEQNYWDYTASTLSSALPLFGAGRMNYVRHQGFNFRTREKLKGDLECSGCAFQIQTGSEKRAEIRLADAICGFLGLTLFNADSPTAKLYPAMPDWFIELKNEAPVMEPQGTHRGQASR
jgi:hypothetical protein